MSKEIDHSYTDELVCPYCGHEHGDDGEMNEAGDYECSKCKKNFSFEVDYSKSYTSRKVPCMNGEPHQDGGEIPWTNGKVAFRCKHCSRIRAEKK